jgi:hypothetical protein
MAINSSSKYAHLFENSILLSVDPQLNGDITSGLDFFVQQSEYRTARLFGKERQLQHPPPTPPEADIDDSLKVINRQQIKRKRCNGNCSNKAFVNSGLLPSIMPQSLPWIDKEIRLVDTTLKGILSQYSWK